MRFDSENWKLQAFKPFSTLKSDSEHFFVVVDLELGAVSIAKCPEVRHRFAFEPLRRRKKL